MKKKSKMQTKDITDFLTNKMSEAMDKIMLKAIKNKKSGGSC